MWSVGGLVCLDLSFSITHVVACPRCHLLCVLPTPLVLTGRKDLPPTPRTEISPGLESHALGLAFTALTASWATCTGPHLHALGAQGHRPAGQSPVATRNGEKGLTG